MLEHLKTYHLAICAGLSKPVGIGPFVLAKFLGLAAFAAACALAWLYIMAALALTLLLSATFSSQLAAGVLALALVIGFATLATFSLFEPFLPASLMHWANAVCWARAETSPNFRGFRI